MPLALAFVIALLPPPATAAAAPPDPWQRPVAGPVLRSFALKPHARFAPGQHRGVDLAAARGATIRSACSGRVTFAGTVPGGGRTVSVRCGRLIATYQHLGRMTVRRGQALARGSPLGTVGRSQDPRAPDAHVHLGARVAATGEYLDPLSLLGNARTPLPLMPPGRAPARHPPALGPAPAGPLARPEPAGVPALHALHAARAPAQTAPTARMPATVWLGLLLVGLAMPVGGLVTVRRRRQRRRDPAAPLARAIS